MSVLGRKDRVVHVAKTLLDKSKEVKKILTYVYDQARKNRTLDMLMEAPHQYYPFCHSYR